jgi:hypothetical protein
MGKHIINMCQNVDTETGRLFERLGQSVVCAENFVRVDDVTKSPKLPPTVFALFARINETVYPAAPLTQKSASAWCC